MEKLESRIDNAASALALGARDAVREKDGEAAVIFGGARAALMDATSPGYTSKQGEWWNTAVDLVRTAHATAKEHGYPHWMEDEFQLMESAIKEGCCAP